MKKILVSMITVLFCIVVFTGCSTPGATPTPTAPAPTAKPTTPVTTATSGTPRYGGTLRYIQSTAPGSPFGWPPEAVGATMNALQLCLYPLLDQTFNGDLLPLIAASYEVNASPDNPSITFHLKKNVKFHDGSPLDAKALKWNLEKLTVGTMTTSSANWKSFDVLDDYTVKVNLTGWQNTLVRCARL